MSRRETGAIGKILLLGRRAELESGAAPLFFEHPLAVVDNDGNQENVTTFESYSAISACAPTFPRPFSRALDVAPRQGWGEESILRWI